MVRLHAFVINLQSEVRKLLLLACFTGDSVPCLQVLHKATTLHFEFSHSSSGEAGSSAEGSSRSLTTIHVPNLDSFTESEHQILAELVRRYKVPLSHRCAAAAGCGLHTWPAGLACNAAAGMYKAQLWTHCQYEK